MHRNRNRNPKLQSVILEHHHLHPTLQKMIRAWQEWLHKTTAPGCRLLALYLPPGFMFRKEMERAGRHYGFREIKPYPDEPSAHGMIVIGSPSTLPGSTHLTYADQEALVRQVRDVLPLPQNATFSLGSIEHIALLKVRGFFLGGDGYHIRSETEEDNDSTLAIRNEHTTPVARSFADQWLGCTAIAAIPTDLSLGR
ncbi:MAG TPA: hypothetical protein VEA18_02340 [Candidatus Kapabacteria bacterium]|nr:hypothetical protein [Candidatus Kapabacteria bacterium]